jgi:hypothetical protein
MLVCAALPLFPKQQSNRANNHGLKLPKTEQNKTKNSSEPKTITFSL